MNNVTPIFTKEKNRFNSFRTFLFHNSSTTLNYKHFLLTGALINFAWVPLMNNTAAFPSKLLFQSPNSRKGKFCSNLQSWLQTESVSLMSVELKQALSSVSERNGHQHTFYWVAELLGPRYACARCTWVCPGTSPSSTWTCFKEELEGAGFPVRPFGHWAAHLPEFLDLSRHSNSVVSQTHPYPTLNSPHKHNNPLYTRHRSK